MVTPADLDRIEALARAATPNTHAWRPTADIPGEAVPRGTNLSRAYGLKNVVTCACGVVRGIRGDSSTVVVYIVHGRAVRGRRVSWTPPCRTAHVQVGATDLLALVEAARRALRAPDPRELATSEDFASLIEELRQAAAWDAVTDEADRLLAHEASLRARADGVPYPPKCPSCGHSPHREDPDGKCWYGGVGGCACARASD